MKQCFCYACKPKSDCKVKVLIEMVKILCEDDQTVLDLVEQQAIERIKNEKINS